MTEERDPSKQRVEDDSMRPLVESPINSPDAETDILDRLLESKFNSSMHELGAILDVKAGLAAILAIPIPGRLPPSEFHPVFRNLEAAETIYAIPPEYRLEMRCHPAVHGLAHSANLGTILASANEIGDVYQNVALARDSALGVVTAVMSDESARQADASGPEIHRALDLASDISESLDFALSLNFQVVRALDLVLESRNWIASTLHEIETRPHRENSNRLNLCEIFEQKTGGVLNRIKGDLHAPIPLALKNVRKFVTFRSLNSCPASCSESTVAAKAIAAQMCESKNSALRKTQGKIRKLANCIAVAHVALENWSKTPGKQELSEAARALVRAQKTSDRIVSDLENIRLSVLEKLREAAVRDTQTLGLLFARILDNTTGGPFGLEASHTEVGLVIESTLNDFTEADLTRAEFFGADLTGLRWTLEGTQWPDNFDIGELFFRSVEEPYAVGVYCVRREGDYTLLFGRQPVSA
ncbi:hypothetical protein ACIOC1_34040 [Streptomyces sp. NPDC088197]|uniref:hypothetical protein n=1 Tax=unclassified Streptomyces TaxID=2593676 RepID=UPI0036ECA26F